MERAIRRSFAALIALSMVSCMGDDKLSMVADLDPAQWREAVQFEILNSDTLSMRDISVFVRYKPSFQRIDSLALHVVTIAPDQARVVEQLTIFFPRTSDDLWRRRLYGEATYRKAVRLSQMGDYRVLIYPQQAAQGVEAVGITLRKKE